MCSFDLLVRVIQSRDPRQDSGRCPGFARLRSQGDDRSSFCALLHQNAASAGGRGRRRTRRVKKVKRCSLRACWFCGSFSPWSFGFCFLLSVRPVKRALRCIPGTPVLNHAVMSFSLNQAGSGYPPSSLSLDSVLSVLCTHSVISVLVMEMGLRLASKKNSKYNGETTL